ncbi:DNA replication/repair protein RecF [Cytophagaceae bacterium ABcell3]|nr:DNA replication/repair protein RecF [Cytophagaceae bacterium ABcell3]
MYLEKLNLLNFKNYDEAELVFSQGINIFTGPNGSGKTNILDAIYYLAITKSAFNAQDAMSIKEGEKFFMVNGVFNKNNTAYRVACSVKQGQKKVVQVDKVPYDKISSHIGKFPVVIITPYDTDLIREGSEGRRKFIDNMISQTDSSYLSVLLQYNHVLKQRNSLLKLSASKSEVPDRNLFDIYDRQLLALGQEVYQKRTAFIAGFEPIFYDKYLDIANNKEEVSLTYSSQRSDPYFEKKFYDSFQKDVILQRTRMGVHRDDLIFSVNEKPVKNYGSQGQQKSYVTALKLAQYEMIKNILNIKPILLLDDIFDKLDEFRISKLLKMVTEGQAGQIFITDARIEKSRWLFDKINAEIRIFKINNGKVEGLI